MLYSCPATTPSTTPNDGNNYDFKSYKTNPYATGAEKHPAHKPTIALN
jgi:hypothetical protein